MTLMGDFIHLKIFWPLAIPFVHQNRFEIIPERIPTHQLINYQIQTMVLFQLWMALKWIFSKSAVVNVHAYKHTRANAHISLPANGTFDRFYFDFIVTCFVCVFFYLMIYICRISRQESVYVDVWVGKGHEVYVLQRFGPTAINTKSATKKMTR